MSKALRTKTHLSMLSLGLALACGDPPSAPGAAQFVAGAALGSAGGAVKFWDALATTRWNERATMLVQQYPPTANGQAQAATSRILTYLSLAQYRAVLAAESDKDRLTHPSVATAVGAA